MEEKSVLLEILGDAPVLRIVDFLIENKLFDYSKKQIIDETGVSKATFYKYWDGMLQMKLVQKTRSFGKTVLYRINDGNPLVKRIMDLELELIEQTTPLLATAKTRKN